MLQLLDTAVGNICGLSHCRRALWQAFDGYSMKGEVSSNFKKHGVEAAKSVDINRAEIKMAAR